VSTNRRSAVHIVARLLGEFLREVAVLIAVFTPLDRILDEKPLTGQFVLVIIVVVAISLGAGIAIEVKSWTNTEC